MRRILAVFIFLIAFGGALEAASKFDKALDKKVQDFNKEKDKNKGSDKGKGKDKGKETVRVIIQTLGDPDGTGVSEEVQKRHGRVFHKFWSFRGIAAELPLEELENASKHRGVSEISLDDFMQISGILPDPTTVSNMDVARLVTGEPQVWSRYGVDGTGIGVAVIDSGITSSLDLATIKDVDFTGSNSTKDGYGHGTHVAGIIAGSGALSGYQFMGGAPNVKLINLRTLDGNGKGLTSDVIKAIEWAIQNRAAYNIRVINLSLGHRPYESALTDPLTIVCRNAVKSGIVVVAAAGNYGKDKRGSTEFGGITSPGTEPSVITVGAVATFGTLSRADDAVASFSSRGPTLDNILKPDIGAPGTKIIAPMAPGNTLAAKYPQLVYNSNYMRLSGTSMAAPFVSAAAALILQKNPGLKPNAVKAILMTTAERRGRSNILGWGAGELNALGAVNLAANINTNAAPGAYWLLNNGLGLTHADDTGNYRAVWGGTIVWDDGLFSGNSINYNHLAWGSTIVWGDTIVWDDMGLAFGTTIVWEDDIAALGAAIVIGQTIVWDTLDAQSSEEDIDAEF
jgi:serine protease AprX